MATPRKLGNLAPGYLDRVIQTSLPLVGPVPYTGGALRLEIGLVSVRDEDKVAAFADATLGFAEAAGVAYVEVARLFVEPLCHAIDLLTGAADQVRLEVGLVTTFEPPEIGFHAVIDADASTVDLSAMSVDANGRLLRSGGAAVSDSYLLLRVDESEQATSRLVRDTFAPQGL